MHTIARWPASSFAPAGVYVNLSLNRASEWGQVVSFMPAEGRLTVKAGVRDTFFLRPPGWAAPKQVRAFINGQAIPVDWQGGYVRFLGQPGDELTITYPLISFTQHVSGLWKDCRPELTMTFHMVGEHGAERGAGAHSHAIIPGQAAQPAARAICCLTELAPGDLHPISQLYQHLGDLLALLALNLNHPVFHGAAQAERLLETLRQRREFGLRQ
jgi:hypothetical protein